MKLVKLAAVFRPQLEEMMASWLREEDSFSPGILRRWDYLDFDGYMAHLQIDHNTEDRVANEVFFALDEERSRFVGAVDIRKHLTAHNRTLGGNIAYGIRPEERRKGLGTRLLALALEKCRAMGMNKVLITCDAQNIGSEKIILKNGGVFESIATEDGETEKRFWITLFEEIIYTPRLIIRREMPADYREVFAWSCDERVYKYLLSRPVTEAEALIPWLRENDPNSRKRIVLLLRSRQDGHAVGTCGCFYDEERDTWSLGYNLRYDDWGKGYMSETLGALLPHLCSHYGAHRFEAECAVENTASERVMQKLGMHYAGTGSVRRKDGSTMETVKYELEI